MKVAIRQVRGNSGTDVWAESLCQGIHRQGHDCTLDLRSAIYQFLPVLAKLHYDEDIVDIIQSNTWNGFAFKSSFHLVVTEHHVVHDPIFNPYRTIPQKAYHRWIHRCERKSLKTADAVTCVSRYTQQQLESVFGYHDSTLIYNGIDTSLFRPASVNREQWNIPEDKTVLFFSGNLSKRKGADLLPKIMSRLGDDHLLLIASVTKSGFSDYGANIRNLGRLNFTELIEIYNLCNIFLFPSRLEGFGLSVAEAMGCGKPVITTNCSSLPELVVDGKGGFLCDMDNVRDFADKISFLADQKKLMNDMGHFNRKRVLENFTIEKMTDGYLKVYQSL